MAAGPHPFSAQTAAAAALCQVTVPLSNSCEKEEKRRGSDYRTVLLKIVSGFVSQHTDLAFGWI